MGRKKLILFTMSIITLLAIIFFIALVRNIEIFDIKAIQVNLDPVPSGVYRVINPLKETNIFKINKKQIKNELLGLPFIKSVNIDREYPSTLTFSIELTDLSKIIVCDNKYYITEGFYLLDSSEVGLLSDSIFIEINSVYFDRLQMHGIDDGFRRLLSYLDHLEEKDYLITNVKYDNNRGESFGNATIEFPSLHAGLWIREPVSIDKLDEGMDIIRRETIIEGQTTRFDLYESALVKRL